ncbi:hypothetical protein EV359DRAFT_3076, partial [Lentinula novae-zelandiae]
LSLMKQCQAFLVGRRMISEGSQFFSDNPHSQAAIYIVTWIMDLCDLIKLNGTPVLEERSTYTHAQKMQAAPTFGFGKIHSLGMQAWHQSEVSGKMLGNPSSLIFIKSSDAEGG